MFIKITPDFAKANSLRESAKITLKKIDLTRKDFPSDTIVDYYDVIHKLLEAKAYEKGIKFKGEGAHKELINYYSKNLFLQTLRKLRNNISYEGFQVPKEQFLNYEKKILKIIKELSYFI